MLMSSHFYMQKKKKKITRVARSHVVGQVVFIQSVGLKAVWSRIKVVTSNATYETFCLRAKKQAKS